MITLRITLAILLVIIVSPGCGRKARNGQISAEDPEMKIPELVSKWSTDTVFKIPESVIYDSIGDVLYVSNIQGNSREKDGMGFISKLSVEGEVLNLEWVSGLDAPKGMGIHEGKLYVTNLDEIVEIDMAASAISNRYPCEGAAQMNDIDITKDGTVYASDRGGGRIFRLQGGSVEKWLESEMLENPNGIYAKNKYLLIGIRGSVLKADYETGMLEEFISNTGGIDGLEKVGDGYFIISDWAGHVHLVHPEKEKVLLLNTTEDNINAADIDFVPATGMLYVPTFRDNRVMAYELK